VEKKLCEGIMERRGGKKTVLIETVGVADTTAEPSSHS
jgi:hypothetical protein